MHVITLHPVSLDITTVAVFSFALACSLSVHFYFSLLVFPNEFEFDFYSLCCTVFNVPSIKLGFTEMIVKICTIRLSKHFVLNNLFLLE